MQGRDVHETFLAEAETEAFWPRPRRDRGVCQPVRGETETEAEAEALGDRSEAETEANNKKMCIFKLFKTWKLFEMYNLTWNGIIC